MGSSEYSIRPALPEDKPKILGLVEHTWSWGDYIPRVLDGWLADGGVFLCFSGEELVGMVHLSVEEGGLGWLEGARVAPAHRNRGVATMLARHVVERAAGMGLKKLRLAVAADNAPSIRHVSKVGFRPLAKFRRLSAELAFKPFQSPLPKPLEEGDIPLVLDSESYSAYLGLYYKSFRWLDLDEQALRRLASSGRAFWVGPHFVVHSSDYRQNDRVAAEVGYMQPAGQGLEEVLAHFASKSYFKVDFVVPEGLQFPVSLLKEEGESFIVFELKL